MFPGKIELFFPLQFFFKSNVNVERLNAKWPESVQMLAGLSSYYGHMFEKYT